MSFVQPDTDEFDRLTFLAWVATCLNRIEAGATARGERYAATAISRLLTELGAHVREGADAALVITDPAVIRAQFEEDAAAGRLCIDYPPSVTGVPRLSAGGYGSSCDPSRTTWFELQHFRRDAEALRVRIALIRPMDREDVIAVTAALMALAALITLGVWQWLS